MAIRGTPTTNAGSSTTPSVAVPTGIAANDIIILVSTIDASTASYSGKLPTGFASLAEIAQGPDGGRASISWKRASGADSGTYTYGGVAAASVDWVAQAIAFSGRDTGNPPVLTATNNVSSNASPVTATVPTVTAVLGDDLVAFNVPDVNASGIFNVYTSHPSGYTTGVTQKSGFANAATDYLQNAAAGATGTSTFVFTLTSGASGWYAGRVQIPVAGQSGGGSAPGNSNQFLMLMGLGT